MEETHKTTASPTANQQPCITYKVGKMTFIVQPIHNKTSSKTIYELLLNLMTKEAEQTA